MSVPVSLTPVRISRRSSKGIIFGLSTLSLIMVGAGILVAVLAVFNGQLIGLLITFPVWGALAASGLLPIGEQKAIQWLPVVGHYLWRRQTKNTEYRAKLSKPRPAGTLFLPGDHAALRSLRDVHNSAVYIHDPHNNTLTGIIKISHPSFLLADPDHKQRRIDGFARMMSAACESRNIAAVSIVERSQSDSGHALREWWDKNRHDQSEVAAADYEQLVEDAGPAGDRHDSYIAVTISLSAAARAIKNQGGGTKGQAAVMRGELDTVARLARSAELSVNGLMTTNELAVYIRTAYDPAVAVTLAEQAEIGRALETAGPLTVSEKWDHIRTDSAYGRTFWISEWPRTQIEPGFLFHTLVSQKLERVFTLTAQPMDRAVATKKIRRQKVEYITDKAQKQKGGFLTDLNQDVEFAELEQREAELSQGHGIVRFFGLITVTARDLDELNAASDRLKHGAIQSSCEVRSLVGRQLQAFGTTVLPIGGGL